MSQKFAGSGVGHPAASATSMGLRALGREVDANVYVGNLDVHRMGSVGPGTGHDLNDLHTRYTKAGPWGPYGIDRMMWRWVEDNPDAQRTAGFTTVGLIGGKYSRWAALVLGLMALCFALSISGARPDRMSEGQGGSAWFGVWGIVLNILIWMRRPRVATVWFRIALLVPVIALLVYQCTHTCPHKGHYLDGEDEINNENRFKFSQCAGSVLSVIAYAAVLIAWHVSPQTQIISGCIGPGVGFLAKAWLDSGVMQALLFTAFSMILFGCAAGFHFKRKAAVAEAYACVSGDIDKYTIEWNKLIFNHSSKQALLKLRALWGPKRPSGTNYVVLPVCVVRLQRVRHQDTLIADWRKQMGLGAGQEFCNIKNPERAWVKARRSYFGDVSRLTDVVRGEIILDTVEQLVKMLKIIREDLRVEVMRGKNRFLMTPVDEQRAELGADTGLEPGVGGNVKERKGYRDIQLSLLCKGITAATMPAGLQYEAPFLATCQAHRAEFQLHIKEFKSIKDGSGHEAYEKFRILLGL